MNDLLKDEIGDNIFQGEQSLILRRSRIGRMFLEPAHGTISKRDARARVADHQEEEEGGNILTGEKGDRPRPKSSGATTCRSLQPDYHARLTLFGNGRGGERGEFQ